MLQMKKRQKNRFWWFVKNLHENYHFCCEKITMFERKKIN